MYNAANHLFRQAYIQIGQKMSLINLENLTYCYPGQSHPALHQVSFSVHSGESIGLLGHNGAGKTTLMSIICGLQQPGSGYLKKQARLKLGLVPQSLAFYARLSVAENLQLFASLYQLKGAARKARLDNIIEQVNLTHKLDCPAAQLSGGEQRRLNFALGILQPADLYLLDEATVGVDAASRSTMLTVVEQLIREGAAIIYTSHYLEEMERIASRILLLDSGKICLDLPQDELRKGSHQLLLEWPDAVPQTMITMLNQYPNTIALPRSVSFSPASSRDILQLLTALPTDQHPSHISFGNPKLEQIYLATLSANQSRNNG